MIKMWYIFIFLFTGIHSGACQEFLLKEQLDSLLITNYEVQKMDINMGSDDLGAFRHKDTLYFSSNRRIRRIKQLIHKEDATYVFNIYTASKKNNRKRHRISLLKGDVNTKLNQSSPVITKDGSTMYFTGNTLKDGKIQKGLHILKATKKKGYWTDVIDIFMNSDAYSNAQAVLNADETEMYFISDKDCYPGDSDIYKVQINSDESFGIPERLPEGINTLREEITPFITGDNRLYFSSKGHPGFGGFDVFYVDLNAEKALPINLGSRINSSFDDFGFSLDGKTRQGFLSSNRARTNNIYRVIEKNPLNKLLKDHKEEQNHLSKLNAASVPISINSQVSPKVDPSDSIGKLEEKQVVFDCLKNCITLRGSKTFKNTINEMLKMLDSLSNTSVSPGVRKELKKLKGSNEKLKKRVSKTVSKKLQYAEERVIDYFNFNSSYLHTSFKEKLVALSRILINNRKLSVEFYVHADARGTNDYNMMLTIKRLKRIKSYLIKKGVYYSQVTGNAYGQNLILNECTDNMLCDDAAHKLNRRVAYRLKPK